MKKLISILFLVLFLASFALMASGCSTSEGFKLGSIAIGPRLASEASGYVAKDSTLDATTKAMRAAQASRLKSDTSVVADITRQAVTDSWGTVKPWLLTYYGADTRFSADERKERLAMAAQMDKLIADEASRPFAK